MKACAVVTLMLTKTTIQGRSFLTKPWDEAAKLLM